MTTASGIEAAIKSSSHAQASALEQAAARLNDLAQRIGDSRGQVERAAALSRGAGERCDAGNDAIAALDEGLSALAALVDTLPEVVAQMQAIQEHCKVIDKLAFHSHLLALNASIESARLGDRGGAFGVVASGIRDLASESRSTAERIQAAVADGVARIDHFHVSASATLKQNSQAGKQCKEAFLQIGQGVDQIESATVGLLRDAHEQEVEALHVNKRLREQAEDNSRRASEIIGALTGRTIADLEPEQCRGRLDRFVLIDVRRADEFNDELGHIPRAQLMTLGDDFGARLGRFDRSERYLFICRSGGRSARAARIAQDLGFAHIYNLKGGMLRWNEMGLSTERAA